MIIQAFPSGILSTNAYVVGCPLTKKAAIIDPAHQSTDSIISFLEKNQLDCTAILLTHSHWDHIADAAHLKKKLQVPVYIHPLDALNLEKPGSDKLRSLVLIEGIQADQFFKEGDLISVGECVFSVIHTPGHSPGSLCLYNEKNHILFSGDTLFKGTIGAISFPTSQPNQMWPSLAKLAKLPPQTKVYPGHGPSTTIGEESWLSNAKEIFG